MKHSTLTSNVDFDVVKSVVFDSLKKEVRAFMEQNDLLGDPQEYLTSYSLKIELYTQLTDEQMVVMKLIKDPVPYTTIEHGRWMF